eukprot:1288376-Pleurochrysis_carterae.AAC.1
MVGRLHFTRHDAGPRCDRGGSNRLHLDKCVRGEGNVLLRRDTGDGFGWHGRPRRGARRAHGVVLPVWRVGEQAPAEKARHSATRSAEASP